MDREAAGSEGKGGGVGPSGCLGTTPHYQTTDFTASNDYTYCILVPDVIPDGSADSDMERGRSGRTNMGDFSDMVGNGRHRGCKKQKYSMISLVACLCKAQDRDFSRVLLLTLIFGKTHPPKHGKDLA